MTEAEWLAPTDSQRQTWLNAQTDLRKLRLFALACLPAISHHIRDPRLLAAIETLAAHVEGRASIEALHNALLSTHDALTEINSDASEQRWHYIAHAAASAVASAVEAECLWIAETAGHCREVLRLDSGSEAMRAESDRQFFLLRCVFGNPFRPMAFAPRWRTETAVALAAGIYDGRHFDRLPILADALEDAGCDAIELLNHLRGPGPHARGCWAVDAVLGRG